MMPFSLFLYKLKEKNFGTVLSHILTGTFLAICPMERKLNFLILARDKIENSDNSAVKQAHIQKIQIITNKISNKYLVH